MRTRLCIPLNPTPYQNNVPLIFYTVDQIRLTSSKNTMNAIGARFLLTTRSLVGILAGRHVCRPVPMAETRRWSSRAAVDGAGPYRAITNRVMMIRPRCFGFDAETALDNHFQRAPDSAKAAQAQKKALKEFDGLVSALRGAGVGVAVEEDHKELALPDAVFPNNWISFDGDRRLLILYPMMAEIRRKERRLDLAQKWQRHLRLAILDMSGYEAEGMFMEGTGSLVLDRSNKVAYACRSTRTHPEVVEHFCQTLDYKPVFFSALQRVGEQLKPIYHTNVMMCVGEDLALVCLECIRDPQEQEVVRRSLEESGRTIVTITEEQVNRFLGNCLQLYGHEGRKLLVMSTCAYNSLEQGQKERIETNSSIVHCPVDTIEALGGGGVRCMLAEVFPSL